MSDFNEMRLGRYGKSGSVDLDKIKPGMTEGEARQISIEAENIFNSYDSNHDHVLDELETQSILADVEKYAEHGRDTIFSKREAKKLIKNKNIVGADADSYFDLLSGIEGKAIEKDSAPAQKPVQQNPPQETTPPANQPVKQEEHQEQPQNQPTQNTPPAQNTNPPVQSTPPVQQNNPPVQQQTPPVQNTPAQNSSQGAKKNVTYALAGESFDDTARRLGFEKGTPEYDAFVKANQAAKGRKWFMVGEEVHIPDSLLGKVKDGAILSQEQGMQEVEKWKKGVSSKGVKSGRGGSSSAVTPSTTPSVTTPSNPSVTTQKPKGKKPVGGADKSGAAKKTAPEKPVKPDGSNGKGKADKGNALPGAITTEIAWLKNHHGKYKLTGDATHGYTLDITAGDNLTKAKAYNIVYKYDKDGKTIGKEIKYDNGQISSYARDKSGKLKGKITQRAASAQTQKQQANLQKAFKGKAHLVYNAKSKKWTCVQTGVSVKGAKVKEVRTTLNNECWQKNMSVADKAKYVYDHVSGINWLGSTVKEKWNRTNAENAQDVDYYSSQQIIYENGRVTNTTYKQGSQAKRVNIKPGPKTQKTAREKIHSPSEIWFNLPKHAPMTAVKFTGQLSNMATKTSLMKDLKIDNDTYNMLAQTAVGIGAYEMKGTNWGEKPSDRLKSKQKLQDSDIDGDGIQAGHHISYGVTQLKYADFVYSSTPKVAKYYKDMFAKYGIHSAKDLNDPAKAAIATVIVLSQLNNQLKGEKLQAGLDLCQGSVVHLHGYKKGNDGAAYKIKDASAKHHLDKNSPEVYTNEVTTQDALALLWNEGSKNGSDDIIDGIFQPTVWSYSNGVRKAVAQYKIQETPKARKAAIETDEQKKEFKGKDKTSNTGAQGSVIFMPAMYADKDKHINTKAERDKLAQKLTAKGIDKNYITQLTTAMANGEVAFDFGLRDSEIDSMTNGDIKLLLLHLNKLKKTVNNNPKAINTSDGINQSEAQQLRTHYSQQIFRAEDDYERAYLTNHHSTSYQISRVGAEHVLSEQAIGGDAPNYFGSNYNRRGYGHVKSKGINTKTTTGQISEPQRILATAANNYVQKTNPNNTHSGQCLTGVKASMASVGIDISDMTKYGSTPRHVNNWFLRSKYFTRVSYVKTSADRSREMVESDIMNLPAGYVVVFVPEDGDKYASQAGHILVTNGYGQGLSDSTDNLYWTNYESSKGGHGKGEHGTFYVYKLSDQCYMENGKIKLKQ